MRRSGAPSQINKQPKFVAPFTNHIQTKHITDQDPTCPRHKVLQLVESVRAKTNSLSDVDNSENAAVVDQIEPPTKKPRFEPPAAYRPPLKPKFQAPIVSKVTPVTRNQVPQGTIAEVKKGYFNVVWCKRSNKKHKKWEGDAVLVTSMRSVVLYDIEGKEIGKSSGFRSGELASLKEDETLPIGGKEILVMSLLVEEEFRSGKCFTGAGCVADTTPSLARAPVPAAKPFMKPTLSSTKTAQASETATAVIPGHNPGSLGASVVSENSQVQSVTPRHNPAAPGALVMSQPSQAHQWKWNKRNQPVVDVVVDPYLSVHLRPHQRTGVTFLYECVMGYRNFGGYGAILADDMGLGKTLQCIALIWTLLKQGPYGGKPIAKRVLVVTPGSLVKNWQQEFKKWLGTERLQVYAVSSDKKVEDFMKTSIYPILIISYEMFVRMYDKIQQLTFDLIVCDEGHRLKNTAIKTSCLLASLSTQRRVVMTGTPVQNDLQEFYAIVEFCNSGVLGSSAAFKRVYEDPIVAGRQPRAGPGEVTLGEERGAELSRLTQMFLLRRTQEINNKYLPPKNEIVVFCRPTQLQLKLYHQLLRSQLIRTCLSGRLRGAPHLICIAALKQICNHPDLVYQKSIKAEENGGDEESVYRGLYKLFPADSAPDTDLAARSGKLSVLCCLLHQLHTSKHPEKIVVVSNHTKTLDLIERVCDVKGYQYLRLDGQTPTGKRQELVQRYNSKYSPEFIFLLSSKAGGVGLNLIGASRLVLYDIDWNPANDLQAMARVWRDGQKKHVHIYRFLTTGCIEEKVFQRQISKQGLSGAVIDTHNKTEVQFSLEDLKDLFSVNMTTDCDTHDLLNCTCGEDQSVSADEVKQMTARPCQLGTTKSQKRNLGMDELMDWKHYSGSRVHNFPEWYLKEAADHISFVFYSELKQQT